MILFLNSDQYILNLFLSGEPVVMITLKKKKLIIPDVLCKADHSKKHKKRVQDQTVQEKDCIRARKRTFE